ncbi:hypothetical protein [Mycobacterium sp. C31M]
MSDEPQYIETDQVLGKFGGENVNSIIPPLVPETIEITQIVGKDGGEKTIRSER